MTVYGYIRVSTDKQTTEKQHFSNLKIFEQSKTRDLD